MIQGQWRLKRVRTKLLLAVRKRHGASTNRLDVFESNLGSCTADGGGVHVWPSPQPHLTAQETHLPNRPFPVSPHLPRVLSIACFLFMFALPEDPGRYPRSRESASVPIGGRDTADCSRVRDAEKGTWARCS